MIADSRKKLISEDDFKRRLHLAQVTGMWLGALLGALPSLVLVVVLLASPPARITPRVGEPSSDVCTPSALAARNLQRVDFANSFGEPLVPSLWTTMEELEGIKATQTPTTFRLSGINASCMTYEISYVGAVRLAGKNEAGAFVITPPGNVRIDGLPQMTSPSWARIRWEKSSMMAAFLGCAVLTIGLAALFREGATQIVTARYELAEAVPAVGGDGSAYAASGDGGNGSPREDFRPIPPAPEPPSPTYALLRCPDAVPVGEEIELEVGISTVPMEDVEGEPLRAPAVPEYRLTVHVLAQGFRLRSGESWRNELSVTAAHPYPSVVLHLTAEPQDPRIRRIRASYLVEGQSIGFAVRSIKVGALDEQVEAPAAATVGVPGAESAADLTIMIVEGEEQRGELLWTFATPHAGIEAPDLSIPRSIGSEPAAFTRLLIDMVNAREGKAGLFSLLRGVGREISDHMPPAVWNALREIGTRNPGKPPSVLILSDEPYIPWELAEMPQPLAAAIPPFLAAQASVGRWVLPKNGRPSVPPPLHVEVTSTAVISGVYPGRWRLKVAEEEARQLAQQYRNVVPVDATHPEITKCLNGDPEADLLHFAVHGNYDPQGIQNGLVLVDQETLHPLDVKSVDLRRGPFVFLNACQVGAGDRVLGDYAGLAAAFLYAGASGVVAPLWSVRDTIAREVALEFYRRVAAGEPPAVILREERARFRESDAPVSATCLAYQFFGHPELRLRGLTPQGTNP